jgi:hypothetical protein
VAEDGKTDWEGQWRYEDRLWRSRRSLLRRASDHAEWRVPDGPLGDLVRQHRHRAAVAQVRTGWVLAALIATIVAGIVYFVGGPLWRIYADGQRYALSETMRAALDDAAALDARREDLRKELETLLEVPGAWFSRVPLQDGAASGVLYEGHAISSDGGVFVYGSGFTAGITMSHMAAELSAVSRLSLPEGLNSGAFFLRSAKTAGDGIVFYAADGTALRADPSSNTVSNISFSDLIRGEFELWRHAELPDGGVVLYGSEGVAVYLAPGAEKFSAVSMPEDAEETLPVHGHALLSGGVLLLYGPKGTLLRMAADASSFTRETPIGNLSKTVDFMGSAALADGRTVLYGNESTVLLQDTGSSTFTPFAFPEGESGSFAFVGHEILPDGELLLFDLGGAVFRLDIGSDSLLSMDVPDEGSESVGYVGHNILSNGRLVIFRGWGEALLKEPGKRFFSRIQLPGASKDSSMPWGSAELNNGGLIIFNSEGLIFRLAPSADVFTQISLPEGESGKTDFWRAFPLPDGGLLMVGNEGPLGEGAKALRIAPDGDLVSRVALPERVPFDVAFSGAAVLPKGDLILYGTEGTLLWQPKRLREAARDLPVLAPVQRAPGARSMDLTNVFDGLPADLRNTSAFARIGLLSRELDARQDEVARRYAEAQADLGKLWTGVLGLERQREEFRTFMADCRAGAKVDDDTASPDALSLACLQGWEAQVARDSDTWWKTLAESVPPGILLLFLLATLSGLYRYNMRMAGFHASRGDALVVLAHGTDKDTADRLTRIADALAADKVEFGKDNSPADQAVEIFKAFVSRTN